MNLTDINWNPFKISDVFSLNRGKRLTTKNQETGNTPFVSSSAVNNGVSNFIKIPSTSFRHFNNFIGVNNSGSVAISFCHPYNAIVSDHVTALQNPNMTLKSGLFISTILTKSLAGKYSFNHEITDSKLANEKLLLPTDNKLSPNWQFMEDYISEKMGGYSVPSLRTSGIKPLSLKDRKWNPFFLGSLFTFGRGQSGAKNSLSDGEVPLVSARKKNNGWDSFVSVSNDKISRPYTLTINNNGDGGAGITYFQETKYTATQDVTVLAPKSKLSKYIMLFLTRIISMQQDKFGFGNKATSKHLKIQRIILPIDKDGNPDWKFMEDYIKSLPGANLI